MLGLSASPTSMRSSPPGSSQVPALPMPCTGRAIIVKTWEALRAFWLMLGVCLLVVVTSEPINQLQQLELLEKLGA